MKTTPREIAQASNHPHYHGKPCKFGHTLRQTSSRACCACKYARDGKYHATRRGHHLPPPTPEELMSDIHVTKRGPVTIVKGASDAGLAWLTDNLDNATPYGRYGFIVEPRYVGLLADTAAAEGLAVAYQSGAMP